MNVVTRTCRTAGGLALPGLALLLILGPAARPSAEGQSSAVPKVADAATIVHVLNRLGFGPRPGDVERLGRMGLEAYIDLQLHPERIPDTDVATRLAGFATLDMPSRELAARYFVPAAEARRARQQQAVPGPAAPVPDAPGSRQQPEVSDAERGARLVLDELSQQKIVRAVFSERQLEEVMVDFWLNHFNVFAGKGVTRQYLTEYEQRVIRPRALGRFRDLLGATAESPAMLFYLDNWMSADPKTRERMEAERRQAAARRARRGLGARPPDEARRREPGLNENYARELMELHTLGVDGGYTQQDVVEVARAFTGWTIANPRAGGGFTFDDRRHDPGKKLVLGREIAAGGRRDGEMVLDLLARHPSTARHLATKLARRFVADDPPSALVERAAARFLDTDGDIRETVRAIVTSPEFFSAEARRAKTKTPLEFVVSALRAVGARVDEARAVVQNLRALGMPPYGAQPPTGYADTADAWVNSGALVGRMNFAVALAANRLRGVRVDAAAITGAGETAVDGVVSALLADNVSPATREVLAKGSMPAETVALALGSPEFQRR